MATAKTPLLENNRKRSMRRTTGDGRMTSPRFLEDFAAASEREGVNTSINSKPESQFSGELLVIEEDANSESRVSAQTGTKPHEQSVTLSHEEVINLIINLESTADSLRQLTENYDEPPLRHRHKVPRCLTHNLFPITLTWQALSLMTMSILKLCSNGKNDHNKNDTLGFAISLFLLVLFQMINLIIVVITTVKLTKQVMHQTVTKSFLGQSYLSTTLLYAGLYTLLYNVQNDVFNGVKVSDNVFGPWELFAKMLFFSISTATLCGASPITPNKWHVQLMTGTQMLMSYVYFASVLFIAVHPPRKQIKCRMNNNKSRNNLVQNV